MPKSALWPGQTPIKLMYQDEARFGRINDVRRCWAPKPMRPLCQAAMLTHEYTYADAAVGVLSGELDSLILPHVNTRLACSYSSTRWGNATRTSTS